jgi:hypothetical protein
MTRPRPWRCDPRDRARSDPPGITSMRRMRAEFGRLHGNAAFHLKWRSENHFYLRLR